MAGNFKVGDLVWAKMKGFQAWPGKIIQAKPEVKRPSNKKQQQFVFFYGSENYAWIVEENIWLYKEHKARIMLTSRIPKGYKEAIEAIEDAVKSLPAQVAVKTSDLPSIEEELAQIFPNRSGTTPHRDYSREPLTGKKQQRKLSMPQNGTTAKTPSATSSKSAKTPVAGKTPREGARSSRDIRKTGHEAVKNSRERRASEPITKARRHSEHSDKKTLVKGTPRQRPEKEREKGMPEKRLSSSRAPSRHRDRNRDRRSLPDKVKSDDSPPRKRGRPRKDRSESVRSSSTKMSDDEVKEKSAIANEDEMKDLEDYSNFPEDSDSKSTDFPIDFPDQEQPRYTTIKSTADWSSPPRNVKNVDEGSPHFEGDTGAEAEVSTAFVSNHVLSEDSADIPSADTAGDENANEVVSSEAVSSGPEGPARQPDLPVRPPRVDHDRNIFVDVGAVIGTVEVIDSPGTSLMVGATEEAGEAEVPVPQAVEETIVSEQADIGAEEVVEEMVVEDEVEVSHGDRYGGMHVLTEEMILQQQQDLLVQQELLAQHAVSTEDSLPVQPLDISLEQLPPSDEPSSVSQELAAPTLESTPLIPEEQSLSKSMEIHEEDSVDTAKEKGEETPGVSHDAEGESSSEQKDDVLTSPRNRKIFNRKGSEEATVPVVSKTTFSKPGKSVTSSSSKGRPSKRPSSPSITSPQRKYSRSSSKESGRASKSTLNNASPARANDTKPSTGFSMADIPVKNIIPTPLKIGFLGLGIMGAGMVTNLLKSGHEVTVWNRTPSKCRDLVKNGALKGMTPAEVVQQCDITFSCVSDPAAVKDLVFGNCGVLQGISPGKGYVDMSTIDVETVTDVSEAIQARGGRFMEAPVCGSKEPAMFGQLVILVAGDRTLFDDCASCLEAMSKRSFYLGDVGNAAKMKLIHNMLMGTCVAALAECLALADKVGLDQEEVLQVLDLSAIACPLISKKGNSIISSKLEAHFPLQHQQKDLRLAINMADAVDQPMHVTSAANELYKKAKAKGYGEHDVAAVYRAADL